jgi:hypothetical protein
MNRNIIAVITGLVSAIVVFLITENLNNALHPLPDDVDLKNPTITKVYYLSLPLSFWLMVLSGWIVGSTLCGYLIRLISKSTHKKLPLIAGLILTLSAIANFTMLPHPTWFVITGLLIFIPSTYIGFDWPALKKYGFK